MAFDLERLRGGAGRAGGSDADYEPGKNASASFIEGGELAGGYRGASLIASSPELAQIAALADSGGGDLSIFDELGAGGGPETGNDPEEIAERGLKGPATTVPHKDVMERIFGRSFDGVEAHLGPAAEHASSLLNANAYAAGNRIAFSTENPDPSLVAHELTHVIQQTGGTVDASAGGGIEKSGEKEAEAVEAAVAAGKPAALDTDPRKKAAKPAGSSAASPAAAPAAKKGIPALKGRPALSPAPAFGTGMSFSPNGFEQSGSYNLWRNAPNLRLPIAAVPGLFFTISPNVGISVVGGVDWTQRAVTARVGVDGSVAAGLSYGNPALCELYANMEAGASGSFSYQRSRAQGSSTGNQGGTASRGRDTWSLDGDIRLQTAFNVGVKLGGGIMEKRFQFGQCEIGRVTGVAWTDGRFQRNRLGWQWGPQPQRFFREMQNLIRQAQRIMNMPREAAEAAWRNLSDGAGWVFNGARGLWDSITPW